jgi:hypothetical protein
MASALPSARRGLDAQKQHAGLPALDTQPSAASIRLPEGAAPKVSARRRVRRAHIRTPARHQAPNKEPGRVLIPGDGATGDQGLRIGLRARQQRLRDACGLSRLNASWRYGLRRTRRLADDRSPQPRSAWSNQARLALLAVTHRYKRTHCLWREQFQIADLVRVACWPVCGGRDARSANSERPCPVTGSAGMGGRRFARRGAGSGRGCRSGGCTIAGSGVRAGRAGRSRARRIGRRWRRPGRSEGRWRRPRCRRTSGWPGRLG